MQNFDADSQKLCRTADGQAADYFENNATDYNLYNNHHE